MVVTLRANTQYNDLQGTVALDDGDFETIGSILGLDGKWHVLGLSVFCAHPSLGLEGKTSADSSYTSLRVWALADDLLTLHSNKQGIEGVIAAVSPLPVTEFVYDTPDTDYGTAIDAVSLLLRASKRLSLVAWCGAVLRTNLDGDDFDVIEERQMIRKDDYWVQAPEQY